MDAKNLLLVEGKDKYTVEHLLSIHNLINFCQIQETGGVTRFLKFKALASLLRGNSEADKIGIIIDADFEPALLRWGTLQKHLKRLGYQFSDTKPNPKGTVVTQNTALDLPTHVGIWVMPDNQNSGKLEDFLCKLIPDENSNEIWKLARSCVEEASKLQSSKKFSEKDKVKAEVHTYLAWQQSPGQPFGTAIKARAFDATAPVAIDLIEWLKTLFN
jgi:hypothetical protein